MRSTFFLVLLLLWNVVLSSKERGKLTAKEFLEGRFPKNGRLEVLESFSCFTKQQHVVIRRLQLSFVDTNDNMLDPKESYVLVQKHNATDHKIYPEDFDKFKLLKDQWSRPGDLMFVKEHKNDSWKEGRVVCNCAPREAPKVLEDNNLLMKLPYSVINCMNLAPRYKYYKLPSDHELKEEELPVVSCCITQRLSTQMVYGKLSDKEYIKMIKQNKVQDEATWPTGIIYYKSCLPEDWDKDHYWKSSQFSIAQCRWNTIFEECQWIDLESASRNGAQPLHKNFVVVEPFPRGQTENLGEAHVGYRPNTGNFLRLEVGKSVGNILDTIIHEMMHSAGFRHTQERPDAQEHLDFNPSSKLPVGNQCYGRYDYLSTLHYSEAQSNGTKCEFKYKQSKKEEMKEWVRSRHNRGEERWNYPFSLGDIAVIKIVYTAPPGKGKFPHHGMFHKFMIRGCHSYFEEMFLYNTCHCWVIGEPLCSGYNHLQEHWSCCFNEDENSKVCGQGQWQNDHSGFWHLNKNTKVDENLVKRKFLKCFKGPKHPNTTTPTFCGRGCTYAGASGHWDCCHNENFISQCTPDRKK